MTDRDTEDLLKEMRQDIKDLHGKLDDFLGRISAAEVYIKGHSTLIGFIALIIVSIMGYLITGAWE